MGFWEDILPGYKGYKEREESRDTDKLLREFLTGQLKEARNRYDDVKVGLTRGSLDLLDPAEKVTQTLSRVTDRLRYANYGFTGKWFGKDKIDVDRLENVHRFDQQLAKQVAQIATQIKALEGQGNEGQIRSGLATLAGTIRDLDEALNERERILRTVGGNPVSI